MTVAVILDHLFIVVVSVLCTIAVGVPLGIFAYLFKGARRFILALAEVLQTIPALALLGIIMVFSGAGKGTVITGLLLYSLLPVTQNTYLGLSEIDPGIKEVALGMGMTRLYRLVHVELPIALPYIFTGIRLAAITSVGVAVFAFFVGGGGLGSVIYNSIRTSNMGLLLLATLCLTAMAIAIDLLMGFSEKQLRKRFSNSAK
ncbi:MAG: ABC transporter permease [Oscillospiraceae bacterium]